MSVGEHSAGLIGRDELGQPRWTWMTELGETRDTADTFDYLKALDVDGLSIVDDGVTPAASRGSKETGYNPYDTAAASFVKRKRSR